MKLILQAIKALFRKIEASRTHWDTRRIVTKEYTFDGNIDSKETIQIDEYSILVKVADTFPEVSSVTNLSIAYTSIPEGLVDEYELSPIDDVWVEGDVYFFDDRAFYMPNGSELSGVHIPSGLYFAYNVDDAYTSKFSVTYIEGELKKLDKKYLPDEVIDSIDNAQSTANSKMNANNPVGTGSFSMGRKANSVVGSNSHAEGYNTTASGSDSHAEGYNTTASGNYSHAEGSNTIASGSYSHAEGSNTTASEYSHAEGSSTNKFSSVVTEINPTDGDIIDAWNSKKFSLAKRSSSHVEGKDNLALGHYSHAEGYNTTASGAASHAEGKNTTASGDWSHAEGDSTTASGSISHAEGSWTIAGSSNQHVQGKYNVKDSQSKYAHIVGNGTYNARSNAHTLDWNGVPWFKGRPQFGGTAQDQGSQTVMANGDKEIILTSSTANSTKKFKITVDDSGTISATEVM